jgi:Zn-dependent protease with chaperone function
MRPRRRLNLFAFPPETNALFRMLILASIMLALFSGSVLRFYSGLGNPLDFVGITSQRIEFVGAFFLVTCLSGLVALGALCLAFLFFLRYPAQIRRRRKIQFLTEKDQHIQEHVSKLALQAGVFPPAIEMPLLGFKGSDAQAFGIGKGRTIALDGGFRILRKTNPDVFTALLRHELAHFVNADVGRTYFSDALWKSIRWLLVFPFLLALTVILMQSFFWEVFNQGQLEVTVAALPSVAGLFVQWGFVLTIAGMIWARLLRTREFYADWRAALWGSQNGLRVILQEETEKKNPPRCFNVWQFHPDARDRLDALEHPETLFKLSPAMLFMTGLLLSFILIGIYFLFAAFITIAETILILRDSANEYLYWVLTGIWWGGFAVLILLVFGLTGWLINGVLLPQVQKQAVLDLLNQQDQSTQYLKLWVSALILVAGIELGFFMTPFSQFAPQELAGILIEFLILFPLLTCLAWWYLIYLKFVASRSSATQTGGELSRERIRFINTVSAAWAFLFFMPGVVLSRFWDLGFPYFLYFNLGWLVFTLFLSPLVFGASWVLLKFLFENRPQKCPHCGNITRHIVPAIEFCEHCGGILGNWLFVKEWE